MHVCIEVSISHSNRIYFGWLIFYVMTNHWIFRKDITGVLLVYEVPIRDQYNKCTPVGTSQGHVINLFSLRSGHRWTLIFMCSVDSTYRYITVHKLSARLPARNWQGWICNIPQCKLTKTFACRIKVDPGVSHRWARRTQRVKRNLVKK